MQNFFFKTKFKPVFAIAALLLLAAGCASQQARQAPGAQVQVADQQQEIKVVQRVEGKFSEDTFYYYPSENKTALDLLNTNDKVVTKDYGSLGQMVLSIDGQKPDSKHFWEFFVNGTSSPVGASSYKPVDGDQLEWKLSEIK